MVIMVYNMSTCLQAKTEREYENKLLIQTS